MNDKPYTLEQTTVRDLPMNPLLENLDLDFIPNLRNKDDREYFKSDMGRIDQARVKSRQLWRNSWAGENFMVEHGRAMRDDEVDAAFVEYFNLDPSLPIDYLEVQDQLRKQKDQYLTDDYKKLEIREYLFGGLAAFAEWGENVGIEAGRLGIDLATKFTTKSIKDKGTISTGIATSTYVIGRDEPVFKDSKETIKLVTAQSLFLKQQVDALAKIDVLPSSFRDDLDELRNESSIR